MKTFNKPLRLLLLLASTCLCVCADDPKTTIQQKLQSEYTLTQPTAAEDDIVTAGAILVLKKGNVMMTPASGTNMYQNTYKDGKTSQNSIGKADGWLRKASRLPGMSGAGNANGRTYVPGEKMWVTKIDVKDDGVVFSLFTDAVNDVRYKATLKFVWTKGLIPPVDQVDREVAEVFSVQPADNSNPQQQSAQNSPQAAASPSTLAAASAPPKTVEAPPAPIPPPLPPTDAPTQTISLGQTTDQVVGILGQPQKVIKLSSKQIYVYKDMKITFVEGKVSDVQ